MSPLGDLPTMLAAATSNVSYTGQQMLMANSLVSSQLGSLRRLGNITVICSNFWCPITS